MKTGERERLEKLLQDNLEQLLTLNKHQLEIYPGNEVTV